MVAYIQGVNGTGKINCSYCGELVPVIDGEPYEHHRNGCRLVIILRKQVRHDP